MSGRSLVLLLLVITSCHHQHAQQMSLVNHRMEQVIATTTDAYGHNAQVIPSADSLHLLILQPTWPMVAYTVIDIESKVVLKTETVRGTVEWHDSNSIIVKEQPGIIEDKRSKPSDHHRIIHLKQEH